MKPSNIHWNSLFDYEAEVKRGIVHTPEYDEKMRAQRAAFDASQRRPCEACGRPAVYFFKYGNGDIGGAACAIDVELVSLVHSC